MTRLSFEAVWSENTQALTKMADKLDKLAQQLDAIGSVKVKPEVDVDTRKAERKMDAFADRVGGVAGAAGISAGVAMGAGLFSALNTEKASDKLAAQLGATPKMAAELGKVAGNLFSQAYGDSLESVNAAIRGVVQSGLVMEDASTETIQNITAQVLDLSTAFESDLGRTTEAVGQLMKTGLAPNAQAALDIVARGFQQGVDRSGDFLDTLVEYSVQFDKFGLSAESATGILVQGMRAGARNSDLVADAIKEFAIRAVDGSKLTAEGFESVGLNAGKMATAIAKGGPTAAAALDLTLDRLRAIKDPVKQAQVAVALFGTQAEDLGTSLFAIDPSSAVDAMGKVAGASEEMGRTLNTNAGTNLESFKRQLTTTFTAVVGGKVLPKVNEFASTLATKFGPALQATTQWVKDNQEWLKPLGAILGAMVGTLLVLTAATKAWAVAQGILNAVMTANPIALVIIAIAALVAGIIYAYNHSEKFRQIVQAAWQGIQTVISSAWSIIKPILDAWLFYVQKIIAPIILWLWDTIVKPVFSKLGAHIQATWNTVIKPTFDAIKVGLDLLGKGFSVAVDAIGRIWNTVKEKTREPINFVIDTVINNGIGKVWNMLAGFIGHGMAKFPRLPLIGMASGSAGGGGPMRQMATGGTVPGTGNRDSVPAMLMPGEFVLSKKAVESLGGTAIVSALHNAARTSRSLTEVLFGGDRPSPGLAYMADGGAVTRGLAFARSQVGKPYVWGGVGPGGFDCSGLMSAMVGVLTGNNPYTRRFTTAAFAGGRTAGGLVPGLKSTFAIGVMQGNPGHMAGTLNGINIEATPPRVVMGPGARGADSSLFTHRFSLPQVGGEFIGGGNGAGIVKKLFEGPLGAVAGLGRFGQSDFVSGVASVSRRLLRDTSAAIIRQIPGFGQGGVVPGSLGSPRVILAHGGERVLPAGVPPVVLAPNVIGSQRELENWLATSLDNLRRKGRA